MLSLSGEVLRRLAAWSLACAGLLSSETGHGQPAGDASARAHTKHAIEELYLFLRFDEAEAELLAAIENCATRCRNDTVGRAWMYVGIIRSTPSDDLDGARDAFTRALAADRSVQLDTDLAHARSQQLWEEAVRQREQAAPEPRPGWDFQCTPSTLESQLGRRIPVSCPAVSGAARMIVRFREWGDPGWKRAILKRSGAHFRGLLPCSATGTAGKLRFYVQADDRAGEPLGNYGDRRQPIEVEVSAESTVVPAFPGASPPERCPTGVDCPPGFPRCIPRGGRCRETGECQTGLACVRSRPGRSRTCQPTPSCDSEDDCGTGAAPERSHWLGFHLQMDFAVLPGAAGVCTSAAQSSSDAAYRCFTGDDPYPSAESQPAAPAAAGTIDGGLGLANVRLLLGYDHALGPKLRAGARAGLAMRGAPADFLPIHVETRLSYWFGSRPLPPTLRPHLYAAAGLGEVNAPVPVVVHDHDSVTGDIGARSVEAWGQFGRWFVGGGAGVAVGLTETVALSAQLGTLVTFPDTTLVLAPSAGVELGL